jgi:type II secretory pathway pseudopilin PulG
MNPTPLSKSELDLSSNRGFTMIEVLLAFALTTVVLGTVFGLLAKGVNTAPTEAQRADLQAQARHALDLVARDVLLAGTNLPPEFPAFTPLQTNPSLDGNQVMDSIEIVGDLAQNTTGSGPIPVVSFDGYMAVLEIAPTHVDVGDLVLLYDDQPENGRWIFGLVSFIELGPNPRLGLQTMPGARVGDTTLPPFINNYNRSQPTSGFITPVTVVTYSTSPFTDGLTEGPEQVLWRQTNWGPSIQVARVEDFQIRYFVSGTIDDLTSPAVPFTKHVAAAGTPPTNTPPTGMSKRPIRPPADGSATEEELMEPPVPQPDPAELMVSAGLVRGVRISVTTRSQQANLVGSTLRPGQSIDEDGFLRITFSSRVAPRNILFGASTRENLDDLN